MEKTHFFRRLNHFAQQVLEPRVLMDTIETVVVHFRKVRMIDR